MLQSGTHAGVGALANGPDQPVDCTAINQSTISCGGRRHRRKTIIASVVKIKINSAGSFELSCSELMADKYPRDG